MQAVTGPKKDNCRWRLASAFACLLALDCLWLACAASAAQQEAQIHVYANGEEVAAITTTELKENIDVGRAAYEQGSLTSVALVARLAGISPNSITPASAAVLTAVDGFDAGETVSLSRNDVLESQSRKFGFRQNEDPGQVLYRSPLNVVTARGPDAFRLEFSITGQLLKVSASCTPAKVGEPVECKATPAEGGGAGWTYSWDFGDQSSDGSGREAAHTYTTAGTYAVELTVASGLDEGASRTVVRVSAPERQEEEKGGEEKEPGSGDQDQLASPTSNPGAEDPGSGTAPPGSVSNGPDRGHGTGSSNGGRGSGFSRAGSAVPGPGPFAATPGERGSGPGEASADDTGAALEQAQSPGADAASEEKEAETSRKAEDERSGGALVRGLLLTSASTAGTPFDPAAAAARRAQRLQQPAARGEGSGGSVLEPLSWIAVVLIVLGVGGGGELISAKRRAGWVLGASS